MEVTVIDYLEALDLSRNTDDGCLAHCDEHSLDRVPHLHLVVAVRDLGSNVLLVNERGVVGSDDEVAGGVLTDRAVEEGPVEALTPLPVA